METIVNEIPIMNVIFSIGNFGLKTHNEIATLLKPFRKLAPPYRSAEE